MFLKVQSKGFFLEHFPHNLCNSTVASFDGNSLHIFQEAATGGVL